MTPAVSLGGMSLTDTDSNGVAWSVSEVDGWFGSSVVAEVLSAPGVAGGFAGEWREDSQHPSVRGSFEAPTTSARDVAGEAFAAMLDVAVTTEVPLVVDYGTGPQTLQVRLADKPMIRLRGDRAVEYELPLIAPDPTKT